MAQIISHYHLPAVEVKALVKAAAVNTAKAYAMVPGLTKDVEAATVESVKQAWVKSYREVYLVSIAFGAVALIASCFIRSIPLEKKTGEVAVRLENEMQVDERKPEGEV